MTARRPDTTITWRVPAALALVCIALAGLAAIDPRWRDALDYGRDAIARGELWRLVTGHLVHLSGAHAALDVAALLLVAWIFGPAGRTRHMVATTVGAMAVIDASLWWLHPAVDRYAGLSGVLHAWFAAGATGWVLGARRSGTARDSDAARRGWGVALLAGLAAKLVLERSGHPFWLGDAGFPVVTAAHRWGAAAGVAGAIITAVAATGRRPSAGGASRVR